MKSKEMINRLHEYICQYIKDTYGITEVASDVTLKFLFGDDRGFATATLEDIVELVDNCVQDLIMPILKEHPLTALDGDSTE